MVVVALLKTPPRERQEGTCIAAPRLSRFGRWVELLLRWEVRNSSCTRRGCDLTPPVHPSIQHFFLPLDALVVRAAVGTGLTRQFLTKAGPTIHLYIIRSIRGTNQNIARVKKMCWYPDVVPVRTLCVDRWEQEPMALLDQCYGKEGTNIYLFTIA